MRCFTLLGNSFSGALDIHAFDHVANPARIYKPIFIGATVCMALAFLMLWSMEEVPLKNREGAGAAKAAEEATDTLGNADFS